MHGLIAIAVLLVVVPGYNSAILEFVPKAYTEQPILKDTTANTELGTTLLTTPDVAGAASGSSSSSTSHSPFAESTTSADSPNKDETHVPATSSEEQESPWSELSEPGPPSFPISAEQPNKRRVVTYDQRQEGKFNVRADLENFMIVLIPPGAASSSLFDIFTKSAQSRSPSSKKDKRRYHHGGTQSIPTKYQSSVKIGAANQNLNYLSRPTAPTLHGYGADEGAVSAASSPLRRLSEFIEGRTPYHVDISANDDEQTHLRVPERQVDVLPPPYPLAYPHLIKPFHLEVEPTLIQALPPPELGRGSHVSGNILDSYNQLLHSGLQNSVPSGSHEKHSNANSYSASPKSNGGYYRMSRAMSNLNDYETNDLYPSRRGALDPQHRLVRFFLSNLSPYPPIDLPDYHRAAYNKLHGSAYSLQRERDMENAPEQLLLDDGQLDGFGGSIGEILLPAEDELELEVPSSFDAKARDLLGDGLERCAPGRRRDSYGMCREIDDAY